MIKNNELSNKKDAFEAGHEISFSQTLYFLRQSWLLIIAFAFLGLMGAVAYLIGTPNLYEASAQIRMAQVSSSSPTNPFGTAVEDPISLISRMQVPTNYTSDAISACGYQDVKNPGLALSKNLKLAPIKGVPNVVELRVVTSSPELAMKCSTAIFEHIKNLQIDLTSIFVAEAKTRLASDDSRIEAARKLISKADESGAAMSAMYLLARDELAFFLTDREKMIDLVDSVKNRSASLISPIYASDIPVAPKKAVILLAGLMTGAFFGLLVALIIKVGRSSVWILG